jgi:hypothetical protein
MRRSAPLWIEEREIQAVSLKKDARKFGLTLLVHFYVEE